MSNKSVFDELVEACANDLFAGRGIELTASSELKPIEYAVTIGLTADHLRGVMGLATSPETLPRLIRADREVGPNVIEEDWLAESVNQLAGRVKNKLISRGVAVGLALPTVLRGMRLEFLSTGKNDLWTYSFESPAGALCIWLDVRFDAGFELAHFGSSELHAASEGELVLF
jgi:CheY-specific phosphatase CheX